MLSDKAPNRGRVIPPQATPPKDPVKIYAVVGGVLGIVLVFIARNCVRLGSLFPFLIEFHVGSLLLTFALEDAVLGAIAGSTIGAFFGRHVVEKRRLEEFQARCLKEQQRAQVEESSNP
ncbi:MAG: hypothetical protein U0793_27770 [Gemmataceae bacterium]